MDKNSDEFRSQLYNVDTEGRRVGFFPKRPSGNYYRKRKIVSYFLLVLMFVGPWIKISGNPLFLFDVINRKFSIFGQIFWPQDLFALVLVILGLFLSVTLFTVIFGRLWCGWACPQTIFLEMVYRRIEYWIEGDAGSQKRLEKADWNFDKIWKRGLKHFLFLFIAFMVSNTMLAYILGIEKVIEFMSESPFANPVFFAGVIFNTLAFYFVFAWFREQACIMVCPYGRLQGVLLDKNTMVISYDHKRGEDRGFLKKNTERTKGDCIDCKQCIAVCPTGIDIRNGTQLECVNCTACIDACDNVMEKVGFAKGLIRFASFNQIEKGVPFSLTSRSKSYIVALMVIIIGLFFYLGLKSDLDVSILKVRGQTFSQKENGQLENVFTYKLINKNDVNRTIEFKMKNPDASIEIAGIEKVVLDPNKMESGVVIVSFPGDKMESHRKDLILQVWEDDKIKEEVKIPILGPFK